MKLNDAKACWQSSDLLPGVVMSDTEMLEMVRQQSQAFDARIRRRDRREMLTMVIAAPLFLLILGRSSSWVGRAGAALALAGYALICWKTYRARWSGGDPEATRPLAEVLRAQRARIDAQISLLDSVLWWYISPLAVGMTMVVVGGSGLTGFTIVYVILVGLISWRIYNTNRRAVARRLRPERDEVNRLLQQLDD